MNEEDILELRDYRYFEKIKPEKDYIIKDFIPVKSLIMLYSSPANFKSLLVQHMAISIASGRKWLGNRTKKKAVLFCDRENHDGLIAVRMKNMRRGLGIRKKDVSLYYLSRQEGDLLNEHFLDKLETTVKIYNIKLIVFDTLHRYGNYQENSADDLSRLYTTCFSPIIDKLGVSILFLHHSAKQGGYRGTSDFKGMCDLTYEAKREKNSSYVTLINHKHRNGELDPLKAKFSFFDKEILLEKVEKIEVIQFEKGKELTKKVMSYFSNPNVPLRGMEIKKLLKKEKYDYAESTLKRSLKDLVNKNQLENRGGRQGYVLVI